MLPTLKEILAISPLSKGRTKVCLSLLAAQGIVSQSDADAILDGLQKIGREIDEDEMAAGRIREIPVPLNLFRVAGNQCDSSAVSHFRFLSVTRPMSNLGTNRHSQCFQ